MKYIEISDINHIVSDINVVNPTQTQKWQQSPTILSPAGVFWKIPIPIHGTLW